MKCDHDWAFDRRVPDGDDLVTIYKCKKCGYEAMGERCASVLGAEPCKECTASAKDCDICGAELPPKQWRACAKCYEACEAECEGLREALRGLMQLTGHDGKFLYVKEHGLPMTNGDQDIIDKAFIRAESALSGKPPARRNL